jgi:hypothetical protein
MVKWTHYSPGEDLKVPGWGFQISRQSPHEGGKVVSLTHCPPLPHRKYSWYSFLLTGLLDPRATVRPEGLYQWRITVIPSGIEPASFRLVARCFNQLRHRVPHISIYTLCCSYTCFCYSQCIIQYMNFEAHCDMSTVHVSTPICHPQGEIIALVW